MSTETPVSAREAAIQAEMNDPEAQQARADPEHPEHEKAMEQWLSLIRSPDESEGAEQTTPSSGEPVSQKRNTTTNWPEEEAAADVPEDVREVHQEAISTLLRDPDIHADKVDSQALVRASQDPDYQRWVTRSLDAGLSPKDVGEQYAYVLKRAAQFQTQPPDHRAVEAELKDLWGPDHDENLEVADVAWRALGPKVQRFLLDSHALWDVQVLRWLWRDGIRRQASKGR